jgi:hypothetical protein
MKMAARALFSAGGWTESDLELTLEPASVVIGVQVSVLAFGDDTVRALPFSALDRCSNRLGHPAHTLMSFR